MQQSLSALAYHERLRLITGRPAPTARQREFRRNRNDRYQAKLRAKREAAKQEKRLMEVIAWIETEVVTEDQQAP